LVSGGVAGQRARRGARSGVTLFSVTLLRIAHDSIKPPYVRARALGTGFLERRAGIETEATIGTEELGFENPSSWRYQPVGWFALRRILRRSEVGPGDVFIDIGSGMGRMVFQAAARYSFRRVIGVELSHRLNEIARANIERSRDRLRCRDVELVTADAAALPDDATVVCMNNPFTGPVFADVADELVASLERRPRRMRVIYANPREEQLLLDRGFHRVRALRGFRPTPEWSRSNSVRMYERSPPPRPVG
jgi:16S rRNA G966 N2-methylase RsmD